MENEDFEEQVEKVAIHSGSTRGKKMLSDHEFVKRKLKLLFERSNSPQLDVNEDLNKFFQNTFQTSVTAMGEKLDKKIETRIDGLVCQITQLRNDIKPSHGTRRDGDIATSSQDSNVTGVPPSKHTSPFGENWGTKRWRELKLTDDPIDPNEFADSPFTFVSEELWNQFQEWSMKPTKLKIGPNLFAMAMAKRIMKQSECLTSLEMDSLMFLWREQTTLRCWKPDRVAFMTSWFSMEVNKSYLSFMRKKQGFVIDGYLLRYGNSELPLEGRTRKVWGVNIDRIYFPLCVNRNHWISMCIDIPERNIKVWDCLGGNHQNAVNKFAIMIPKIVKAVQSPTTNKQLVVKAYSIKHVPMKRSLNKSGCDCGAYAIKFMECYLLGLDISLVSDENILGCRHKIEVDLWQAANDPKLVDRMSKLEPPVQSSCIIEIF